MTTPKGPDILPIHAYGVEEYNPTHSDTRPELPDLPSFCDKVSEAMNEISDGNPDEAIRILSDLRSDMSYFSMAPIVEHMDQSEDVIAKFALTYHEIRQSLIGVDSHEENAQALMDVIEEIDESITDVEPPSVWGDKIKEYVGYGVKGFFDSFPYLSKRTFYYNPYLKAYMAQIKLPDSETIRIKVMGGGVVMNTNSGTMKVTGQEVMFSSTTRESVKYTNKQLKEMFETSIWNASEEELLMFKMVYPEHHSDILDTLRAWRGKENLN
ncbi:hypothetical protein [Salmonella phage SSBI34]|nr:hypothetical protein [Salmonella phage SSBI34]